MSLEKCVFLLLKEPGFQAQQWLFLSALCRFLTKCVLMKKRQSWGFSWLAHSQGDRFCKGIVSVHRLKGLNLHLFSKTRQLWTRHLFLLVVWSDDKEKTGYHVLVFFSWCFLERQHESVVQEYKFHKIQGKKRYFCRKSDCLMYKLAFVEQIILLKSGTSWEAQKNMMTHHPVPVGEGLL